MVRRVVEWSDSVDCDVLGMRLECRRSRNCSRGEYHRRNAVDAVSANRTTTWSDQRLCLSYVCLSIKCFHRRSLSRMSRSLCCSRLAKRAVRGAPRSHRKPATASRSCAELLTTIVVVKASVEAPPAATSALLRPKRLRALLRRAKSDMSALHFTTATAACMHDGHPSAHGNMSMTPIVLLGYVRASHYKRF